MSVLEKLQQDYYDQEVVLPSKRPIYPWVDGTIEEFRIFQIELEEYINSLEVYKSQQQIAIKKDKEFWDDLFKESQEDIAIKRRIKELIVTIKFDSKQYDNYYRLFYRMLSITSFSKGK